MLFPNLTETVTASGKRFYPTPHSRDRQQGDTATDLVPTELVFESSVNLTSLRDYVTSRTPPGNNYLPFDDIRSLNIVLWRNINSPSFIGGIAGNKFYPNSMEGINSTSYNLRQGFFSSVRPRNGSLLLNVNAATSAFYSNINLWQWIQNHNNNNTTGEDMSPKTAHAIRGLSVIFVNDPAQKQKVIRAVDVRSNATQLITFPVDNQTTTVEQHMRRQHNITLQTQSIPGYCVNLGGTTGTTQQWFPVETLRLVDWQIVRGTVDNRLSRDMLALATRKPNDNSSTIMNDGTMNLSIDQNLITFRARMLSSLRFLYGGNNTINPTTPFEPSVWNLLEGAKSGNTGSFLSVPHESKLPELHIIQLNNSTDYDNIKEFLDLFATALKDYGFTKPKIGKCEGVNVPTDRNARNSRLLLAHVLDRAYANIKMEASSEPELLLISLQRKDISLYADIKLWCDIHKGVKTMCITGKAITKVVKGGKGGKPDDTVLANLCLKANVKLGGQSHRVHGASTMKNRTMIVGADVTHSGRGVDPTCPSLSGVVSSTGEDSNDYIASARLQPNNTEYIKELNAMMQERLTDYRQRKTFWPSHILFYRDGVSESQYGMVKDEELHQIQDACTALGIQPMPRITLIVVGKRHHARFFPVHPSQEHRLNQNFKVGLCVDSDVIAPNRFNFYLQSHDNPLGTARSGHYVVIHNGSGYTTQELQDLTLRLCYIGSKATKGLSICVPARYADTLCNRLRCYMKLALEGDLVGTITQAPVDAYQAPKLIWGSTTGNPWNAALNGIMFYL